MNRSRTTLAVVIGPRLEPSKMQRITSHFQPIAKRQICVLVLDVSSGGPQKSGWHTKQDAGNGQRTTGCWNYENGEHHHRC